MRLALAVEEVELAELAQTELWVLMVLPPGLELLVVQEEVYMVVLEVREVILQQLVARVFTLAVVEVELGVHLTWWVEQAQTEPF